MSMKTILAIAVASSLCPVAFSSAQAQLPSIQEMGRDLTVSVRAETSGEVSISAWSRSGSRNPAPDLAAVLHCQSRTEPDLYAINGLRCKQALHRDGLALEGVIDLAPIARNLDPADGIQLWLNTPQLGFASASIPFQDAGAGMRAARTARFAAGAIPPPIAVRFGYRPDQLAGIVLPLAALALVLAIVAAVLGRAGLAALSRSLVLLGTILWMGMASELQLGALIQILLYGNPLASIAALLFEFWPPLLCIAIGAALGSRRRPHPATGGEFSQIFFGLAVIPLLLTCAIGALPRMMNQDWPSAVPWLAATPILVLLRRSWIRTTSGARVQQLNSGELKERVSALAARAGRPQTRVLISFSTRSQVSAAFALPGKCIYLTAPLVRSLSKREVDAVAAHELSHFSHSQRGQWMALGIAMVLFETPVKDAFPSSPIALLMALAVPVAVFLGALSLARKREFSADANAAALTGDPQAMISSLARVLRNNNSPLDLNPAAEWISSHPSTRKRIRALAAMARLSPAEVEILCAPGDPPDSYEIPAEEGLGTVFSLAWQNSNARLYGWTVITGTSISGLLIAWLLRALPFSATVQLLAGLAAGCLLTKALASSAMALNFARLKRRLENKLSLRGQLVGLACESVPHVYNGFRFSDAGILRFAGGRLLYQSERTTIALNPADVVEVSMVSASPSNWLRLQPMVRFRCPGSAEDQAFILHPVAFLPTQRRLFRSLVRWRHEPTSTEGTSIQGFPTLVGQPFRNPSVANVAKTFLVPGAATTLVALLTLNADWWSAGLALAIAAAAHLFMFLPSILYRPPRRTPATNPPAPPAEAG